MALQGVLVRAIEAIWAAEELILRGDPPALLAAARGLYQSAVEVGSLAQPGDQGEWGGARRLASVLLQARFAFEATAAYRLAVGNGYEDLEWNVFLTDVDQPLQDGLRQTLSHAQQLLRSWWLAHPPAGAVEG